LALIAKIAFLPASQKIAINCSKRVSGIVELLLSKQQKSKVKKWGWFLGIPEKDPFLNGLCNLVC
jgi:hypothetical protein